MRKSSCVFLSFRTTEQECPGDNRVFLPFEMSPNPRLDPQTRNSLSWADTARPDLATTAPLNDSWAGTYLGDFKELGGVQHPAVLRPLHSVPTAFIDPLDTCQATNTTLSPPRGSSSSPPGRRCHLQVQQEGEETMVRFC